MKDIVYNDNLQARSFRKLLERTEKAAPSVDISEICTTVYQSSCKTTYEEREVEEDVIECDTIQEEKCREADKTCVINCDPICVKLPVKKCKVETKKVKKYTPGTECNKVPRKVCGPRSSHGSRTE